MWWTAILDKIVGRVSSHYENKQRIKDAEVEARISRINSQQDSDNSLDRLTVADRGFKDEWVTYTLLSIIILTVFNPLLSVLLDYDASIINDGLKEGFHNLKELPEEIWYGFLIVLSDIYGLRTFMRELFGVMVNRIGRKKE